MAGTFELKPASGGQFMFNLKAPNGQVILTSENYTTKASAQNGIASVRANAPSDARYERKKSVRNEPYFDLKAANGEKLGRSEMYSSDAAMENGIASVKANAPGAVVKDLA
jgi:uncharacterized protein YegP (UPF0339 family)